MSPRYLIDTNILVHLVRNDRFGKWIARKYGLLSLEPAPVYLIVSEGEINSIAIRRNWGIGKLSRLRSLLMKFECQFVDNTRISDAYTMIDSETQTAGFKMGKNDIWIAALAHTQNLTLLTTDRDFDPIASIYIQREWIDLNALRPRAANSEFADTKRAQ